MRTQISRHPQQTNTGLDASLTDQPVTTATAPDVCQQNNAGIIDTEAIGYTDPLSQFQLPLELLEDWPWPFDLAQSDGMLPLGFEHWR